VKVDMADTQPVNSAPQPITASPQAAPPTPPEKPQRSGWQEVLSTIAIIGTALLVALFIIFFVFRSYEVDGPSMQSSLQNGDKLVIWKVPRTWSDITRHAYIPNRGDVVVFNEKGLNAADQQANKQLIKRVIGLPGDHVVVKNGAITVYNKEHPQGFDPDKTLPYGTDIPYTTGNVDVTLRPDQIFVCGDNRSDSLDSRIFGPINADQIVGKLAFRVFPINKAKTF
jgi:signal peptidase I